MAGAALRHTSAVPKLLLAFASCLVLSACGDASVCPEGETVTMNVRVQTVLPWADPRPVSGAEVCLEGPTPCDCVLADDEGFATLQVPANSEVTVVMSADRTLPNIGQRITTDTDVALAARLTRQTDFGIFLGLVMMNMVDGRGHIGIGFLKAPGGDSSGATVSLLSLDDGSMHNAIYIAGLGPDLTATATDEEGLAFFLNVPPGRYSITSNFFANCAAVESGWPRLRAGQIESVEVVVQAGAITGMSAVNCNR